MQDQKTLPADMLRQVRSSVQRNDHTDAHVTVAEFLGDDALIERAKSIQARHNREGELTLNLRHKRFALYQDMMKIAREVLSKTDYAKLHQAL